MIQVSPTVGNYFKRTCRRRFERAVGAVIRVLLWAMFHRCKANDVVHVSISGCSGTGHVRMESVEGADQERQCRTSSVRCFYEALHALHDVTGDN